MAKKEGVAKKADTTKPIKKVAAKKEPKKRNSTKKTRIVAKSTLGAYTKRACKKLGLPRIDTDSLEVVDNSFFGLVDAINNHAKGMLDDKKTYTRHVAKSAAIAYLTKCGVSNSTINQAIKAADAAVKQVQGSI